MIATNILSPSSSDFLNSSIPALIDVNIDTACPTAPLTCYPTANGAMNAVLVRYHSV